MGSKSKIAKRIIELFPSADNFYDIFGGGFSMTHCLLTERPGDFKNFHFNELRPGVCDLIKDAINGKYSYANKLPEWVSREDFTAKKDTDPEVKILWSFGNNGRDYLFSKEIESYKKSMHMAVVFNQFDTRAREVFGFSAFPEDMPIKERRFLLRKVIRERHPDKPRGELQQLQQLQQLERLERLEQLERLQQLQQLELSSLDYREIEIKKNSVVYCDPPYIGTCKYDSDFNHKKFWEWASEIKEPLFVSEYICPNDNFTEILAIEKRCTLSASSNTTKTTEKVFCNKVALGRIAHD